MVENLEWIDIQNLLFQVNGQEASDVVAAITKSHLCEVVRTKAEVFGFLRDVFSHERSTRHLDHSTNMEVNFHTFFLEELFSGVADNLFLLVELVNNTDKGNHDFGMWVETFLF